MNRALWSGHSVNPMEAWLASQNGLLADAPQRQSVTRLRTSYVSLSADITVMPPRTQIGPATPCAGSATMPIDGVNSGSM